MSSQLRVDNILPSAGTALGIGTASGSITFNSNISGDTIFNNDVTINGVLTYEDVTNIDSVGVITARKGIVSSGVVTATAFHGDGSQLTGIDATQIVTGNTSVQTVDTGSDGHVIVNTEGSERLRITSGGSVDVTGKLRIDISNGGTAGSGTAEGIFLRNTQETDNNAVTIFGGADDYNAAASAINFINVDHSANAGDISFDTRSTSNSYAERMRIMSDGTVKIGTGTGNPILMLSASTSGTSVIQMGDTADNNIGQIWYANSDDSMRFFTNNAERLRIDSSGRVGVNQSSFATSDTMFSVSETTGHCEIGIISKNDSGVVINMGDTDSYNQGRIKYDNSDNSLTFRTSATDRLRITFDGNVGINNTAPADKLHVGGNIRFGTNTTYYGIIEHEAGVTGANIYTSKDTGGHIFKTGLTPTEKVRIDSSGRLLLQTTNSTGTQLLKINGDTSATTNGGHIALTQGRTSPGNGATHGLITFGTETRPEVVKVVSFVDGTWTDGQYHPSGLYISTTDYNRNSPTEKIRITDIGEINCYSSGACIQAGTLQGGGTNVYFYEGRRNQNTGGTRTYIVWSNGNVQNTNNSYGSLSDQRLKENIVDATSQWDDIKSLQIRKYNFREATGNETHTQIGLIAQEVESVSPGLVQTTAVSEGDVLQDADGNQMESVKSINYSVLYMKSVKALQEAQTRIEALEAAVAALQGS